MAESRSSPAIPVASCNGGVRVAVPTLDRGRGGAEPGRVELERLREENLFLQRQLAMSDAVAGELPSARDENRRLATTVEVLKAELGDRLAEVEPLRRSAEQLAAVVAACDQAEAGRVASVARAEQAEAGSARRRASSRRSSREPRRPGSIARTRTRTTPGSGRPAASR